MTMRIPKNIKKEHIISALNEIDREGYPKEHESTKFYLLYEGRKYPPKWVIRTANIFANAIPFETILFSGGEQSNNFLKKFGFRVIKKKHSEKDNSGFDFETMNRERIWREIQSKYQGQNIPTTVLRNTYRLYGGAAGIWVDKERTSKISNDSWGVTVAVFHKGTRNPDDISEASVIYHYPITNRRGGHDENEINATKNAKKFNIPIFVIAPSKIDPTNRDIKKGFVRDWDDTNHTFLIEFGNIPEYTKEGTFSDEIPFNLNQNRKRSPSSRSDRDPRFSFDVFKRYERRCAVCNMNIEGIVTAVHIKPVRDNGTDDPRNGIPLCQNHRAAFDKFYFTINPTNYQIVTKQNGPSKEELEMKNDDILDLKVVPHKSALKWHYKRFLEKTE
jgi:putative restriction endonuclease